MCMQFGEMTCSPRPLPHRIDSVRNVCELRSQLGTLAEKLSRVTALHSLRLTLVDPAPIVDIDIAHIHITTRGEET